MDRGEPLPLDAVTAAQLLDLFRDPDHDVDRIVEFINENPRLTAETLRRCNSAVFRGATRTTDLFEAVSRLGFYELYDIISASIGSSMLPDSSITGQAGLHWRQPEESGKVVFT